MKSKLILIGLLLYSIASLSQTDDTVQSKKVNKNATATHTNSEKKLGKDCDSCATFNLIYDFKCKKLYYKDKNEVKYLNNLTDLKVKYKEGIRFKIVNLNRYLYETSLSYDDVVLTSEEPQILKSLFLGDDFDFKLPITTEKTAKDSTKANENDFRIPGKKDKFIIKLKNFKDSYNKLLENYLSAYSLCTITAPCCGKNNTSSYSELSNLLFELKLSFYEYKAEVISSKSTIENQITILKQQQTALEEKKEKAKTEAEKNSLEEKLDEVKGLITVQETFLKVAESEEAKIAEFKTTLDGLTDKKLMEVIHFGNNLKQSNYEYIAPTIYPSGDRLSVNLKINPNTSDMAKKWQTMSLDSDEFNLEFSVRNKWFFSFSTGPFIGLSDNFRVDKYGWQKVPVNGEVVADSKYKLVRSGREGMPVGIAGFANLGTKLTDGYGLGISVGAGASILDETRLAYFAGITQFFGQDKQLNLTLGLSFMQINELDRGLYPSDLDNTQYEATFDLAYTKKFVAGGFVSLSYTVFNPSNHKKGSSSSGTAAKPAEDETDADTDSDSDSDSDTTTTETKTETDAAGDSDADTAGKTKKTTTTKVTQNSGINGVLKQAKKIKIKK